MKPSLRSVPAPPLHRAVTEIRAAELFPQSPDLASKWLAAIAILRAATKCGWTLDKRTGMKV